MHQARSTGKRSSYVLRLLLRSIGHNATCTSSLSTSCEHGLEHGGEELGLGGIEEKKGSLHAI